MRNGGDAIALFDGIAGDGQKTGIVSHQGNVRAVQRGDERQAPRRGHLPGQQAADGVGDSVMDVEDVQGFRFKNFQHLHGEGERVRGMVKEGIGDDGRLMEMDARVVWVHADGRSVGDEMDVVPAGRQFLTQFGGDDTRAAVGGIAGNSDTHRRPQSKDRAATETD